MAHLGSVQQLIMNHLADAPATADGGVYDLRVVARVVRRQPAVSGPSISRAVHTLIERGELVWMRRAPSGYYLPNEGWEDYVRYVRRPAGN